MKKILFWSLFPLLIFYCSLVVVFIIIPLIIIDKEELVDRIDWIIMPLDWWESAWWNLDNG